MLVRATPDEDADDDGGKKVAADGSRRRSTMAALYGVGLGPGEADLVTVRGKGSPRKSATWSTRRAAYRGRSLNHVDESKIGDLDFPMTKDEEKLRTAWKAAAAEIAPNARDGDVAFVTLGDPNVYSTFGHLRRTINAFHPDVELEDRPRRERGDGLRDDGESRSRAVRALSNAVGAGRRSDHDPVQGHRRAGDSRGLLEASYGVTYGRQLFMEQGGDR